MIACYVSTLSYNTTKYPHTRRPTSRPQRSEREFEND
jgi:hypothetical protein